MSETLAMPAASCRGRLGRKGSYQSKGSQGRSEGTVPAPSLFYCLSRRELRRTNRCPIPSLVIFPTVCYGLSPALPALPLRRKPRPPPPDGSVVVFVRYKCRGGRTLLYSCDQGVVSEVPVCSALVMVLFLSDRFARCPGSLCRIPHLWSQVV